jgi:hypothetical protein
VTNKIIFVGFVLRIKLYAEESLKYNSIQFNFPLVSFSFHGAIFGIGTSAVSTGFQDGKKYA